MKATQKKKLDMMKKKWETFTFTISQPWLSLCKTPQTDSYTNKHVYLCLKLLSVYWCLPRKRKVIGAVPRACNNNKTMRNLQRCNPTYATTFKSNTQHSWHQTLLLPFDLPLGSFVAAQEEEVVCVGASFLWCRVNPKGRLSQDLRGSYISDEGERESENRV